MDKTNIRKLTDKEVQAEILKDFQNLEAFVSSQNIDGRAKAIALKHLQTAYLWIKQGFKIK